MARTESNMIPLGTLAPEFHLLDTVSDKILSLEDVKGHKGTVVMFICNHCPFVKHINSQLVQLAETYINKGFGFVAISSNDVITHPQDSPEAMKQNAAENNFVFPYLYDETQDIAKAYDAACTPDFYIFNDHLKLVYRGQLDDSRPGNGIPVTGIDIRNALDALVQNQEISKLQKPSIGCNIKWKA